MKTSRDVFQSISSFPSPPWPLVCHPSSLPSFLLHFHLLCLPLHSSEVKLLCFFPTPGLVIPASVLSLAICLHANVITSLPVSLPALISATNTLSCSVRLSACLPIVVRCIMCIWGFGCQQCRLNANRGTGTLKTFHLQNTRLSNDILISCCKNLC